jgi:very-short-patch-repair endonuclease
MIAARQHGVVSTRQLYGLGLGRSAISDRVGLGRLHRLHRGVYAVGHRSTSFEGRALAAVLAFDSWESSSAAVSHRSAAVLWGLLPAKPGPIDISLIRRSGRGHRRGVRVHRPRTLSTTDLARRKGIPLTTPVRTISDLRWTAPPTELRRAIRQAEVLGLSLNRDISAERTRSELEHLFLGLCRRHRLPMPEVNVRVGARVADFLWRDSGLIVETDGYRYHRGRAAFEDDRARDLELRALGFEVLRLSYRQVTEEPERVAAVLRKALRAQASWR